MIVPSSPILIVEDMPSMRKLIMMTFKQAGFTNLSEAKDGAEAWKLIESAKPRFALVVSDWMMPVCTGIDLLKRVRGSQEFGRTPFMMVTAEATPDTIREATAAGVDQYIVKPFNKDLLLEKLSHIQAKLATANAA
jgi:two-component system, chemotaxis family, chemotaxis protein CheY